MAGEKSGRPALHRALESPPSPSIRPAITGAPIPGSIVWAGSAGLVPVRALHVGYAGGRAGGEPRQHQRKRDQVQHRGEPLLIARLTPQASGLFPRSDARSTARYEPRHLDPYGKLLVKPLGLIAEFRVVAPS